MSCGDTPFKKDPLLFWLLLNCGFGLYWVYCWFGLYGTWLGSPWLKLEFIIAAVYITDWMLCTFNTTSSTIWLKSLKDYTRGWLGLTRETINLRKLITSCDWVVRY
jgi:hypothetical protein